MANSWAILAALFLGTVAIDASVHALLTSPFETTDYWLYKVVCVGIAGLWLLSQPSPRSNKTILIGALIFAGILSVYYRSFELITGIGIGGRVPTWVLGSHTIEFNQHPLISTALWSLTHLSAFYVPARILFA